MIKLTTKKDTFTNELDFNYTTNHWENVTIEELNGFIIQSNDEDEVNDFYDKLEDIFGTSMCPNCYEDEGIYYIEDRTNVKIDKRKLKGLL